MGTAAVVAAHAANLAAHLAWIAEAHRWLDRIEAERRDAAGAREAG